jgi:hypothetical protein
MDTVNDLQTSLLRMLQSICPFRAEQKKDSIHIVRGRAFVGIHPKKSYLGINVVLDRAEASPTASKVEKVSANRYHHYYKITSEKELTKSFERLLQKAYDLTQPKK